MGKVRREDGKVVSTEESGAEGVIEEEQSVRKAPQNSQRDKRRKRQLQKGRKSVTILRKGNSLIICFVFEESLL